MANTERTSLIIGFNAKERAAAEADMIEINPALSDDLKALEDAMQALATRGLYAAIDAELAKKGSDAVAEAIEAVNQQMQQRQERQHAARRDVPDPFAPPEPAPTEIPDTPPT